MSPDALASALRVDIVDEGLPEPSWNIKPTQTIAVVADTPEGRRLTPARWSLVPPWSPELKLKYPTFNARIETAAEKPTFRASVASKRCVVPFDGYYEWLTEGTVKTPYYVHRTDGSPLLLAGLYSWWRDTNAEDDQQPWHLTATILTRASCGTLTNLHDRMPVLIGPELLDDWLDSDTVGDASLLAVVSDSSCTLTDNIHMDAVAPLRGDGPELIIPVSAPSVSP